MKKPVVFTQRVFKIGGAKRIRTSVCSLTMDNQFLSAVPSKKSEIGFLAVLTTTP